ncbi:hypothetical protein K0T92_04400 [Paenibacillus oenotherae]|uniref:Uncharacterized protein n=1 Tax=Paenibacillus oenotherae TaxID=1435645 RepID=A0ABS7D203_9BACL|nr:hypothetical protein [Paenibacillus oenotherae]MBW7473972.1 hypothetical protein [Paenibacillus oenotherae]
MQPEVIFSKKAAWAIPPVKEHVTVQPSHDEDFRWIKQRRVKGACWPYRAAREIGWTILSPIDVEIYPATEIQIGAEHAEEIPHIQHLTGIHYWQRREDIYLGVKPSGWFQLHQFKVDNNWHQMFIPNGEGTFEWRMGWSVQIPNDHVLLFQPLEHTDNSYIIHPGLLTAQSLDRFHSGLGLPIAFEPRQNKVIKRSDPLAKMLVLHKSALSLREQVIEAGHSVTGEEQ